MPDELTNTQIADALDELADLHELDGSVIHRIVAYRNAAKAVRAQPSSVLARARAGTATELPGIGAVIQEKVVTLADTGQIPALEKLRAKFPPGLLALTKLEGLGPKRARKLYEELGIDSLAKLETAIRDQQIRGLKGFGAKAEESLAAALLAFEATGPKERVVLSEALVIGEQLVAALAAHPAADKVSLAGSARRWTDTVKDLDIIATAVDPGALTAAAAELDLVARASKPGPNAVRLVTHTGLEVDLRIVEPDQFGNVLQHLTGSKEHNMAVREYAVKRGFHVSEYGVLEDATETTHRCATEAEIYALLGLDYLEPELREGSSLKHPGNRLVEVSDLRGDLHAHTTASDGKHSIEEMARGALAAGYEYLAITDHSPGTAGGVPADKLKIHLAAIRKVKVEGIELLTGSEVNILPDGGLDYADELLAELDWVVASVHTSFKMSAADMTQRIITAMQSPHVDCIGHLSGRRLDKRPGYEFDFDAVLAAAVETGTLLEINANPLRRDILAGQARAAAAAGLPVAINTDAHRKDGFSVNRYGVATARRGGLGPDAIANSRPWAELKSRLK